MSLVFAPALQRVFTKQYRAKPTGPHWIFTTKPPQNFLDTVPYVSTAEPENIKLEDDALFELRVVMRMLHEYIDCNTAF